MLALVFPIGVFPSLVALDDVLRVLPAIQMVSFFGWELN
jgi:hypothetical protein